jgi:hypothetical protein
VKLKVHILTILLFSSIVLTVVAEGEIESIEAPSQVINMVEVAIEESSIPIDTSFNGSFEGVLHCSLTLILNFGIFVDSVDVFLEVEFPGEISVTLSEYEFTLTPGEPFKEFIANVTVDPGTSSYMQPTIMVSGSARAQPSGTQGGVISDSAQVDILPFYTAEISFVNDVGSMNKGDEKTFTLLVENRGNANEAYIIGIANGDELRMKNVELSYESRVDLEEGEDRKIDITVKTSDKTTRGSCIIRMEVWSEINGPGNKEESNAVLVVDIQDPYLQGLEDILSQSPWMVYLAIAIIVIIIVTSIYLLLRWRAKRAWKKRLKQYQDIEDSKVEAMQPEVVEAEELPVEEVQFQITSR